MKIITVLNLSLYLKETCCLFYHHYQPHTTECILEIQMRKYGIKIMLLYAKGLMVNDGNGKWYNMSWKT